MGSVGGAVALVVGIAVVFFVPVLVWVTVIAGLIQIVRGKIRESRSAPNQSGPGDSSPSPAGSFGLSLRAKP